MLFESQLCPFRTYTCVWVHCLQLIVNVMTGEVYHISLYLSDIRLAKCPKDGFSWFNYLTNIFEFYQCTNMCPGLGGTAEKRQTPFLPFRVNKTWGDEYDKKSKLVSGRTRAETCQVCCRDLGCSHWSPLRWESNHRQRKTNGPCCAPVDCL